jgi:hypothetical protein
MEKLPQRQNGLWCADRHTIKGYICRLFGIEVQRRVSPVKKDEERFSDDMRDQFLELKKKGLSIPIFTL